MSNKSWMLSAAAIKVAKECIKTVEIELSVRLSLTHPDFLQMLNDYAELCDSEQLVRHVQALNRFAAGTAATQAKSSVVELKATGTDHKTVSVPASAAAPLPPAPPQASQEPADRVQYKGKSYPRFMDGKEFRGLYRGQPKYA